MTAADAQLHLRYSTWASRKLLDAVLALPTEDVTRTLGVSHTSIAGTLGHIQMADWIWFTRVVEPMDRPAETMDVVQVAWPQILAKWEAWADTLTDARLDDIVAYTSMLDGKSYEAPLWQLVLHLVNHATLHRGQVMAMLRQVGVKPPSTDLIYFYRELQAAQASA